MEVYALRARGYGHPGNSALALRAALHAPVAGVIVDLRLTKDLHWILGPDTREEAGVFRIHARTRSALGKNVVTLDAALALFSAFGEGKQLLLDVRDEGEIEGILSSVRRHHLVERTILIAWNPEVLARAHRREVSLRLGLCVPAIHATHADTHAVMPRRKTALGFVAAHTFDVSLAAIAKSHPAVDLPQLPLSCVCIFALSCSSQQVADLHARGLKVLAYPVNNALAKSLLERQGVDGMITSEPVAFSE